VDPQVVLHDGDLLIHAFVLQPNEEVAESLGVVRVVEYLIMDESSLKEDMDRIMKLYSSDVFEQFMEDPKCSNCGKVATQRCSKCKNQWYCSRECQLKQWKAHKALCEIISNNRREEDIKNEEYKKVQ
jgi:predicted Zn-ribbon and HTH transcriptional regulator